MADKPIPQPKADAAASEVEILRAKIAALQEEVSAARTVTAVDGSVHGIESNVKARVALSDGSVRLDY